MKSRDSYPLDSKNDGTPACGDGKVEEETSFTNSKARKDFSDPINDFAGASSERMNLTSSKAKKRNNNVASHKPKNSGNIEFK